MERCPLCDKLSDNVQWFFDGQYGCKVCADRWFWGNLLKECTITEVAKSG